MKATEKTHTDRKFNVICFDWDGTAVADRGDDATEVRSRVEALIDAGVTVVVVSGTGIKNIGPYLDVHPSVDGKMFMYLSRGSETYQIDTTGTKCTYRHMATATENVQLTGAIEDLATCLEMSGLDVSIEYERLNRRKLDMIPEWIYPRTAMETLQRRVEARLAQAGLSGVGDAITLARQLSIARGLADPRITSDMKNIEIGLTDKSHSMMAILKDLVVAKGYKPSDLLMLGDEFGPVGSSDGSDYLTIIPELSDSTFISVGPEPNGVPDKVLHLGGGPDTFLTVLDNQLLLRK